MSEGIRGGGMPRLACGLALALWVLGAAPSLGQAITVSGPISGQVTWSGEVRMTGDVSIPAGARLTIQAGTRVAAQSEADDQLAGDNPLRTELIVDGGQLSIEGTQEAPVILTSTAETPARGNWEGIVVNGGSFTLAYATVEHAVDGLRAKGGTAGGSGSPAAVFCTFRNCAQSAAELHVPASLTDCTMQGNQRGVELARSGLNVTLTRCTIADNTADGVFTQPNAALNLTECTVTGNRQMGVNCQGTLTMEGGRVASNLSHGIGATTATLTGVEVTENGAHGVFGNALTLVDCVVSRSTMDGVLANQSAVVSESTLTANERHGLNATAAAEPWLSVTDSTITGNGASGLLLAGPGDRMVVSGNRIQGNADGLIYSVTGAAEVSLNLSGNDILDNTASDLRNDGAAPLTIAAENYWGPQTTQELQANQANLTRIVDGRDDPSRGQVTIQAFATSPLTGSPAPRKGDVDLNGSVDIRDVLLALRSVALLVTLEPDQRAAGDIDGNGSVDIRDVLALLRAVAALAPLPT